MHQNITNAAQMIVTVAFKAGRKGLRLIGGCSSGNQIGPGQQDDYHAA
jgi:hypothetical protein